jgi:hypothetical protein
MSQILNPQTIINPHTGQPVSFNCVLAMNGRSTLCLIDKQGVRWGEVWLDELPDQVAQQILQSHTDLITQPTVSRYHWLANVAIWAAGTAILAGILIYL